MFTKKKSKYTDSEIIKCLETGENNQVLEVLYKQVFPKIKAYIISNSGSETDALDIFQDAMVILCKQVKTGRYDKRHELVAFLYSVSRNLWINHVKKKKRLASLPDGLDVEEKYDFSDDIVTPQKEQAIKEIIKKLGEKCYELLKRSVFLKASSEEICKDMGFSTANAVKTQKYKCKQKLIHILEVNPTYNEVIE